MRLAWVPERQLWGSVAYAFRGPNGGMTRDVNRAVQFKTKGACEQWIRRDRLRWAFRAVQHAWCG